MQVGNLDPLLNKVLFHQQWPKFQFDLFDGPPQSQNQCFFLSCFKVSSLTYRTNTFIERGGHPIRSKAYFTTTIWKGYSEISPLSCDHHHHVIQLSIAEFSSSASRCRYISKSLNLNSWHLTEDFMLTFKLKNGKPTVTLKVVFFCYLSGVPQLSLSL